LKTGGRWRRDRRFWLAIMHDETAKAADRLEASRLLAVHGWGKPVAFGLVEDDDPLGRRRCRWGWQPAQPTGSRPNACSLRPFSDSPRLASEAAGRPAPVTG